MKIMEIDETLLNSHKWFIVEDQTQSSTKEWVKSTTNNTDSVLLNLLCTVNYVKT